MCVREDRSHTYREPNALVCPFHCLHNLTAFPCKTHFHIFYSSHIHLAYSVDVK